MAAVTTGLSRLFKAGGLEVRDTFCWRKAINHGLLEFWLKIVILYQTLFFLSSWEVVGIFLQCCCLPMGLTSMGSELRWKNSISRKVRVKLEMGSNWMWDISNVRWEEARSGQSFEVTNPATGEVSWRLNTIAKFYKTSEKRIGQNVIFEFRFFALYLTCQQRTLRFDKKMFKTRHFPHLHFCRQQLRRRTRLFRPGSTPLPKKGLLSLVCFPCIQILLLVRCVLKLGPTCYELGTTYV